MFLTLTFHWCVVSCQFFWKNDEDFNFSNALHPGSRNPSPFFHVLRPRPQPHLPLTSRTRVEPLANWEAHVYLKGYKDGVRFSESTSSSNPNYQILHPGFWFQLITAPVEQILNNFNDVTTRWEQSIKASSQLLRATLLHKETFFDDVIPVDYNFLRCGVGKLWCPNLPQNEQLEFKNYQQNLFFLRKASFSSCHVWWNNV